MNRSWPYLLVAVPPELGEQVTAVLFDCGCSGTSSYAGGEGEDRCSSPMVSAWFPDSDSRDEAAQRLTDLFGGLEPARRPAIESGTAAQVDWMARWREGQRPFAVGRRLLVIPGEDDPVPAEYAGRMALRITPGLAFGTGHHESTRFCLEQLEAEAGAGVDFLDVGTGAGILALAAVLLGCRRVVGTDNDPQAIEVAAANIARHGLAGRIDLLVCGTPEAAGRRPFGLVAANILGSTLIGMAPQLAGPLLAPGGRLLLAGILAGEEEQAVLRACGTCGLRCLRRVIDGEWAGLVLSKPRG
jgi:ribosomal protein L11 methyltransferase